MCARYTLSHPEGSLAVLFGALGLAADATDVRPRFNVAPTQQAPVVVEGPKGVRRVEFRQWGLVPSWADDPSIGSRMINARSETVGEKPSFRAALRARRCLVPADGFYEWTGPKTDRRPWHVRMRSREAFTFAGLHEHWARGDRVLETFTVLTTTPNDVLRPIHDRMPVILSGSDRSLWLDPDLRDPAALLPLLRPHPAPEMEAVPVGRWVNDPRHDDPRCLSAPEIGLDSAPGGAV